MRQICIVVPCYNEAKRIDLAAYEQFYARHPQFSFCFVNDGSTDNTLAVLQKFAQGKNRIAVLNLNKNGGKAEAVRQGMLFVTKELKPEWAGYFDADLAAPLGTWLDFEKILQHHETCKVFIGSRVKRMGAHITRNLPRHYLGRIFATVAGFFLKIPVYDTQCGAKLFHKDLAWLWQHRFVSSWLFDVELFARLLAQYGTARTNRLIYEMPLNEWYERPGSKVKPFDFLKLPLEFLRIYSLYKSKFKP